MKHTHIYWINFHHTIFYHRAIKLADIVSGLLKMPFCMQVSMQETVNFWKRTHTSFCVFSDLGLKIEHSKTICRNTHFVANAHLPNYIPNNVNALTTVIVHYYLKYIPHFCPFTSLCAYGLGLYLSYSWTSKTCGNTTRCDGNIANATQLYYKVVLNEYSIWLITL